MIRFMLAIALCAVGQAAAAETWSCSVIDDGKPQIVKFTTTGGSVTMSDWGSRVMKDFGVDATSKLRLITDTKDALVAIAEPYVNREPATWQEVSIKVYVIDKYTRELTITKASTATKVVEMKGNCAQ